MKEDDIAEETEHSSSKHSPKHSQGEEEVISESTSSTDLGVEDADLGQALNIPLLDSRPPKRQRKDAWDLALDDDDSEYVFSSTDSVTSLRILY